LISLIQETVTPAAKCLNAEPVIAVHLLNFSSAALGESVPSLHSFTTWRTYSARDGTVRPRSIMSREATKRRSKSSAISFAASSLRVTSLGDLAHTGDETFRTSQNKGVGSPSRY
jgi:hypothetical protein